MKIVADENIPLIKSLFEHIDKLILKPGRAITRADLLDAQVLLVRSITKVDEALLHNTAVKFVGSTTAGANHLDTKWLDKAGIIWSIAAGCNAIAVAEYVICVIAALQKSNFLSQKRPKAAVIGVGNIGDLVVKKLKILGFEVFQCDPIRAMKEKDFFHINLEDIKEVDLISLHIPLNYDGIHPTYQIIEKNFLQRQKPGCILINSARGEIINIKDLKQYGKHLVWCFDVWENEPKIDEEVLKAALIATPHIAGYTVEAKIRGIEMIYSAMQKNNILPTIGLDPSLEAKTSSTEEHLLLFKKLIENTSQSPNIKWQDVVLKLYDPGMTTEKMKQSLLKDNNTFDNLRKNFPERHEQGQTDNLSLPPLDQ